MSFKVTSRASNTANSPSVTTTSLLIFIAPSMRLDGSVINANQAATTYLINFAGNQLGVDNATVTVGPASQPTGSYGIGISIPNTGPVQLGCSTQSSTPTACVATLSQGFLNLVSTTIPPYTYIPVTVTAGLEKLDAASTIVPSASGSASLGTSFSSNAVSIPSSRLASLTALLGVFLGWKLLLRFALSA